MTRRKSAIAEREVETKAARTRVVEMPIEEAVVLQGPALRGGEELAIARATRIVVQLPPSLAERIHLEAEAEFRTPAQQCAYLLTRALTGVYEKSGTRPVTKSAPRDNGIAPIEDEAGPFPVYHVGEGCCGRVAFLATKRLRPGVDQVDDATFVRLTGEPIPASGETPLCGSCGQAVTRQTVRFEEPVG